MAKAETIRQDLLGKTALRLVRSEGRFYGMADGKQIVSGEDAVQVWDRLLDEAGRGDPRYFGFDGARTRFLHWFGEGFQSPSYLAGERDYKVAAKQKLESAAPVEKAATGSGFGEAVLAAVRATNLLYPVEKARLQNTLRGSEADAFVRAAARFALGDMKSALAQMQAALKPEDNAKWTVVTYLPFLWRPEHHMFLKPEVTKDFAARVGHRYAQEYQSSLKMATYESLLDLAARTTTELSALKPRDRIDVQSFIWVVGAYREGSEKPAP